MNGKKDKAPAEAIQRTNNNLPTGTINPPNGPAMIQIIDVGPSNLGPVGYGGGGAVAAKPAGINILGAVLRRWWLVLLVALVVGGGGILAANRLVAPTYESEALVLYISVQSAQQNNRLAVASDPADIVRTHMELLTKPEISLKAAAMPELQQALPWLRGLDVQVPAVDKMVVNKLRGICEALQVKSTPELISIHTEKPDPYVAAAVVNAFADAFAEHCAERVMGRDGVRQKKLKEQVAEQDAFIDSINKSKAELMQKNDFDLENARKAGIAQELQGLQMKRSEAEIRAMAARAELAKYKTAPDQKALNAQLQLDLKARIQAEKEKDSLLMAAVGQKGATDENLAKAKADGKADLHYDVVVAKKAFEKAKEEVIRRENEIAGAIEAKVKEEQALMVTSKAQEAQDALDMALAQEKEYDKKMAEMGEEHRRIAVEVLKLEQLNATLTRIQEQRDALWKQLVGIDQDLKSNPDAIITVAERADVPQKPTDDKRVKVQAASVIGGLFLGIYLALIADKFDKRLRHPRDIEPLLGAPVLGMIPRIAELKRAKGELARNLIAEEFRLIRTQLLFGHPDKQFRTICVTSPAPGDGKTSLAVNLAISLAKAGRRVLLVDADMRNPDIHRIFDLPEAPGFAELLLNTADPAAAIKKTDIENLDVLASGLPIGRPSELLSRPDAMPLLELLADTYDQIVFDTAPLLPVSDTHVLLSMVDGVICSFNAQVDRDTIAMVEEILRRGRAKVIGSVMNQVKYKQSTTYHRGKSAYSSYYYGGAREESSAKTPKPSLAESAVTTLPHEKDED